MSLYFVDSSALAKRYLNETGSLWVLSWIEPSAGNIILISELAFVEIQSLLARRVHEGTLTQDAAVGLRTDFLLHYRDYYLVVHIETTVLREAGALVNRYRLRTLDAIQLACAKQAARMLDEPIAFIAGDKALLSAAAGEDFATDSPYLHT